MDARTKFLRRFGDSPHYGDRQLAVFAALTAVGANLVFWGLLFKYRVPETAVRDSSSSVQLLSSEFRDAWYWRRWICHNDPAKSGSSAYAGGFSAQLPRPEFFDPPAGRPRYTPEPRFPEMRKFEQPESAPDRPVGSAAAGFPLPAVTAEPPVPKPPPSAPVATDDRGREIRISAAGPVFRSERVTGDTVLWVTAAGGRKNLMLWRSCGDPGLDGRAAAMVFPAVEKLDPPPDYVSVSWPEHSAAEVVK